VDAVGNGSGEVQDGFLWVGGDAEEAVDRDDVAVLVLGGRKPGAALGGEEVDAAVAVVADAEVGGVVDAEAEDSVGHVEGAAVDQAVEAAVGAEDVDVAFAEAGGGGGVGEGDHQALLAANPDDFDAVRVVAGVDEALVGEGRNQSPVGVVLLNFAGAEVDGVEVLLVEDAGGVVGAEGADHDGDGEKGVDVLVEAADDAVLLEGDDLGAAGVAVVDDVEAEAALVVVEDALGDADDAAGDAGRAGHQDGIFGGGAAGVENENAVTLGSGDVNLLHAVSLGVERDPHPAVESAFDHARRTGDSSFEAASSLGDICNEVVLLEVEV